MERPSVQNLIAQAAKEQWKELNLSGMDLSELPSEIGNLTSLTDLYLNRNQLSTLPEAFGNLTSLTHLYLSANQLNALPEAFGNLTSLRYLKLNNNQINALPESIGNLTSLTSLDLSANQLNALPEAFGNLTSLTFLDLNSNPLTGLPDSVGNLTSLKHLYLNNNQLKALPDSAGNLTSLTFLDLSENQLNALPEAFGNLSSLTYLYLSGNQINALPESIGNLTNLRYLYLWNNQLNTLPESIVNLTNLTDLYLSENQLNALPETFGNLSSLTDLYLSGNQLNALPETFGNLSSLTYLYLNSNQLTGLPESIGQLNKLKELILYDNKLLTLPQELTKLTQLKKLDIRNNDLGELPPEVKRKYTQPAPVFNFIRQLQEEGSERIYEAKLLIIGEGGAGKTSLANKLIDSKYKLKLEGGDNPEKSTEGIDVLRFDFPHSSGNPFRINIWDFGGQEIYHATHQFFLTKRSLYLLVADTRQDNTDFNYWLEVVELLSEASPAIIVKNEKQDRPCQVNENQLRGRFPNLEKILPTNLACPNNRGLSEILTAVQHHISQLPHIGTPLPKTWVRVREALEADNRNYITQDEFLTLCDIHGFKRREDKLQLSGYLHDLGVCLHFQDDPILKNWIILKPEWGTTAVYTVLDTPEVQQALGCFTHEDLAKIWADDRYSDMRYELLQLMMRFKLCYEIPHRPGTYIAPQLLSPNQPKYTWDDRENLILSYHYEFMPKGMLTRFAVEMHKLIDGELIWKDGVILTDGNARAEVIEAYYKNEIRIRVSGFPKKDLLTRIRHEFNKIHDSYEKLRYQELIPCNCPTCKGSQNPHAYALKKLQERLQNQAYETECDKPPYHKVNVHSLIDDAIGYSQDSKASSEEFEKRRTPRKPKRELTPSVTIENHTHIHNANQQEQIMSDQSKKIQNFNAPMSGVIASDNASVTNSTFTQTNNANTAELLNLITTLRQTATQFPPQSQEDVIINIEDLETEIQKPADQRSIPRLKRSLIALFGIASLIASPIAGMTDFTNNVLEIGNKLHIELPQLP
ncbi:COR domain-containing protein [Calothrix sp. PCC 6303]|uniref:leucine-rich repeat domain-containing protein n=1 Tax=Calothrix sp. PCC 6303 TaxID=1170562 RepID=UPI0002A03269|nr:COR domain-containing protein [Calothrix sp. PCC 6303]AFY99750.1 Adenylate cyclase [Calothrix sp. PCC 6303]